MSILFDKDGKMYHKVYSMSDIDCFAEKMKQEIGIYDNTVICMIMSTTPADDIRYVGAFLNWDYVPIISIEDFPKNWDYKKILDFLITKFNNDEIVFSWYDEIEPEVLKYGQHEKTDYNIPYITDK